MSTLCLAFDPFLDERYAQEIAWTWRYLLNGAGYAWRVCHLGEPSDIAYVTEPQRAPHARIVIQATPRLWERRSAPRLAGVGIASGFVYPLYEGERADEQVITYDQGRWIVDRDVVFDVFWLLTGQEEAQLPKNRHGYVDLSGTPYLRDQVMRRGLASGIGARFEQLLVDAGIPPGEPRWPYAKRAAAAISHDVDYPEVVRWLEPLRVLQRQGVRGLPAAFDVLIGKRHHWQFDSWLALERTLGVRSVFYFVARQGSLREYALGTPDSFYDIRAPHFRALFRNLIDAGCEIGLHSSYHAYARLEQFAREKRLLEEVAGVPVVGNRHHYWHLDPLNPEATLAIHEQLGFLYDASLAHDRYIGWRRGSCWPFFPLIQQERRELRTLQLPTAWMDSQIFLQRDADLEDADEVLRELADRTVAQGGMLLVNVHDYVFDDVLFPGWSATLRRLWEYLNARGDFWMTTPAEIATHWQERYRRIAASSIGLGVDRSVAVGASL
ncbi:polysaccharide deacetylase family protein [Roseiflexus sp.]|uniref:polysaccharide deacetylase family protein n=1 Tax=Roseiflexus sp. TaxID=2562120 RepID=UPI00398BB5A4